MKKFVFLVLAFFIAVTQFVTPAYGQTGTSTSSGIIPVQECGYANAPPPGNKCCSADLKMNIGIPPTGSILLDAAASVVNSVLDTIVNTIYLGIVNSVKDKILPMNKPCFAGKASTPLDPRNTNCVCITAAAGPLYAIDKMCDQISSSAEQGRCKGCLKGGGIWTSIGCVSSNLNEFIQNTLLGWGIGLAGGVSMLCIIYSAFMMQTSGGNAEKIKKSQQLLTACITGLMFIIFSVLILRVIGVNILQIPGFS